MSISNFVETKVMDALFNDADPVLIKLSARYIKLHIGDPGEDGTANAATETTRKSITSAASSDGVFTSTNDLVWTNILGTETLSYVSLWDTVGPAGGNCLWTGPITVPKAIIAGDTFTIASTSLTVTLQ